MVVFDKSLVDIKIHKNRKFKGNKNVLLKFGEFAFVNMKESKIELIQLSFIKKFFKKLINNKKKKSQKRNNNNLISKNYKIWVNLLPNYVLSRKSKNSRMGKGKGSFERWVIRITQGCILAEFLGISQYRLKQVLAVLNKKFNTKFYLISSNLKNNQFSLWSKPNTTLNYFNKYRAM